MALEVFDHLVVGPLQCNCYVAGDPVTREAIVIDPGGDPDKLAESLATRGLTVTAIVATHAHFDHIVAAETLRASTGAPFYLHEADAPLLGWYRESGLMFLGIELPPPPEVDASADAGEVLRAGSASLEIVHTPGHSPGSISLVTDGVVFSGDTLFAGGIGRYDLPGGDGRVLVDSIRQKLFGLDPATRVFPGHGPGSTIERERASNPFVGERGGLWSPGA